MGEYHAKFLRLTTMILDYFRHTEFSRILLYEIGLFIYLLIYLFIYLFNYLFIYLFTYLFCAQAGFLPLLKPLKMNSSEFSDILERAR